MENRYIKLNTTKTKSLLYARVKKMSGLENSKQALDYVVHKNSEIFPTSQVKFVKQKVRWRVAAKRLEVAFLAKNFFASKYININ